MGEPAQGPMPGRISGAFPPGSGVSTRSVVRPWGATGCGWHKWDTGMGQHPVPVENWSLQRCKSQILSSQMGVLRFFCRAAQWRCCSILAAALLQLELPARRFLVLLEAMLRLTQRQPRRGWGLHPRDRGSLLLPVPPAAAAGVSLWQETGEGGHGMENWQAAERGVERMSSNPEKCGRAGGREEWEERPRGATVRRWETERGWKEEGGWKEEVLAGGQGLPVAPIWAHS